MYYFVSNTPMYSYSIPLSAQAPLRQQLIRFLVIPMKQSVRVGPRARALTYEPQSTYCEQGILTRCTGVWT